MKELPLAVSACLCPGFGWGRAGPCFALSSSRFLRCFDPFLCHKVQLESANWPCKGSHPAWSADVISGIFSVEDGDACMAKSNAPSWAGPGWLWESQIGFCLYPVNPWWNCQPNPYFEGWFMALGELRGKMNRAWFSDHRLGMLGLGREKNHLFLVNGANMMLKRE